MYKDIREYFNDADWSELSEYEKKAYFSQWENWQKLLQIGVSVKPPAFVRWKIHPQDKRLLSARREPNPQKYYDDDWTPENFHHNSVPVKKNTSKCEVCGVEFTSLRLLNKHISSSSCIPSVQGIAGRHLKQLTDRDFCDLGINKGARIDIANAITNFQKTASETCTVPTTVANNDVYINDHVSDSNAHNGSSCLSFNKESDSSCVGLNSDSIINDLLNSNCTVPKPVCPNGGDEVENVLDDDWMTENWDRLSPFREHSSFDSFTDCTSVNTVSGRSGAVSSNQEHSALSSSQTSSQTALQSNSGFGPFASRDGIAGRIAHARNSKENDNDNAHLLVDVLPMFHSSQPSPQNSSPANLSFRHQNFRSHNERSNSSSLNMSSNAPNHFANHNVPNHPSSSIRDGRVTHSSSGTNTGSNAPIMGSLGVASLGSQNSASLLHGSIRNFRSHNERPNSSSLNMSSNASNHFANHYVPNHPSSSIRDGRVTHSSSGTNTGSNAPIMGSLGVASLGSQNSASSLQSSIREAGGTHLSSGHSSSSSEGRVSTRSMVRSGQPSQEGNCSAVFSASGAQRVPLAPVNRNRPLPSISGAQRVPKSTPTPATATEDIGTDLNHEDRVNKLMQEALKKVKITFDFDEILPLYRGGDQLLKVLQSEGLVVLNQRKLLSQILATYIRQSPNDSVSEVEMREQMAITLIWKYPKFQKKLLKRTDRPWHHWYNPSTNTGYIENANVGCQRNDKRITGKGIRRSSKQPRQERKLVDLPKNEEKEDDPDSEDYIRNVTEASNLVATPGEKANILNLMRETFGRRRQNIEFKEQTTSFIIRKFPHFLSYGGEVIEQEFRLLKPDCSGFFIRDYEHDFAVKLIKLGKQDPRKFQGCDMFGNDVVLNFLLILRKLLPTPRRSYEHERRQPLHGNVSDLIHVIKPGTDPKGEAEKRRTTENYYLQPYLMAQGTPGAFGQMYLVCGDSELLQLPRQIKTVKAIDLLFKTFYALHLHYPLGWKNVFRFLQVHIYQIPVDNPRESQFDDIALFIRRTL